MVFLEHFSKCAIKPRVCFVLVWAVSIQKAFCASVDLKKLLTSSAFSHWEVEALVLCSGDVTKVGGKLGKGGVRQELRLSVIRLFS